MNEEEKTEERMSEEGLYSKELLEEDFEIEKDLENLPI